jgi:hypothetical protein
MRHHLMNAIEIALQKIAAHRDVLSGNQTPSRIKNFDNFLGRLSPEIFKDLKKMPDVESRISGELGLARGIIYEVRRWEAATGLSELGENTKAEENAAGAVMNIIGEERAWEKLVNKVGSTLFGEAYQESVRREVAAPPPSSSLH